MTKLILSFLAASILINIILFSMYRTVSSDKARIEQSGNLCQSALESSNQRANASEERCRVLDSVVKSYQEEAKIQSNQLLSELEQLELIQNMQRQAAKNREVWNEKGMVVASPSDRLPDDLTRLLRESYSRNKGSVPPNP